MMGEFLLLFGMIFGALYIICILVAIILLWMECDISPYNIKSKSQLLNSFWLCFVWPYLLMKPIIKRWHEIPDEEE
jgi:hypothetical protein